MSIKVLLFRCLFLSASLVAMYSLGMFGGIAKWRNGHIFYGVCQNVLVFWG